MKNKDQTTTPYHQLPSGFPRRTVPTQKYQRNQTKPANKSPRKPGTLPNKVENEERKGSIYVASTRNHKEISSDVIRADCMNHGYKVEKAIGEGAYAKVKLAEVLPSKLARNQTLANKVEDTGNFHVAIKVIDNRQVPKEFLRKFLPRELANHVPLAPHNSVVRVFEQFGTTERVYVVMEYCSRGDLLDLINQKISESCKGIGEDKARHMFKQMCEGLAHIHGNQIVHRDIKCENILIDESGDVKVTDFGFSCKFTEKSSLLKTSCGSYAYTAPEVIKSKPYDGFKSDCWSLGVILFAMLNGRLPFNDAQLMEMEEDMKMQRLRFERTVSFESMVLVRRILQYNPLQRPSVTEILSDPWLTGKRLIPRQLNKPKWISPYHARKDEADVAGPDVVGTNAVYYKGTIPESRAQDATVTVNHENKETVVLKSRTGSRKNIWTSGPPVSSRPNTWPRSDKETRNAMSKRGYQGATCRNAKTTVVVRHDGSPNRATRVTAACGENKARVSAKTVKMSKWFMDKYTNSKPPVGDGDVTDCGYCQLKDATNKKSNTKPEVPAANGEEIAVNIVDEACASPTNQRKVTVSSNTETRSFKSVSNTKAESSSENVKSGSQSPVEKVQIISKRDYRSCSTGGAHKTTSYCSRRDSIASTTRKTPAKSAPIRPGMAVMGVKEGTAPTASQSTELTKQCLVNYMVNRSTSPAERVKYFRDRLMKLYGGETHPTHSDGSGLPPLMVQALKPPKDKTKVSCANLGDDIAPTCGPVPARKSSYTQQVASWRKSKRPNYAKPIQRVVLHSSEV